MHKVYDSYMSGPTELTAVLRPITWSICPVKTILVHTTVSQSKWAETQQHIQHFDVTMQIKGLIVILLAVLKFELA